MLGGVAPDPARYRVDVADEVSARTGATTELSAATAREDVDV